MLSGWMAGEQALGRSFYLLLTLVRSLDAISFVLLSFLCIRDYRVRRTRWGGGAYCALMVAYAIVYLNLSRAACSSSTSMTRIIAPSAPPVAVRRAAGEG